MTPRIEGLMADLSTVSGEAPQVPVASKKSGTVFEKRLIEAYIQENGRDPVTGEDLSTEDLVELKTARVVKPRPPALTSIPSLLSVFQNEWDALALETFTLKQHLAQLRQELSTALYNNDAAVRVIARLTRERDEARDALGRVSLQDRKATAAPVNGVDGEAMQVDAPSMSEEIVAKIDATQERLSRGRRRRPLPEDWATPDSIQSLDFLPSVQPLQHASKALALSSNGGVALLGGSDGSTCTYDLPSQATLATSSGDGVAVDDIRCWENDDRLMSVAAKASGEIVVLDGAETVASFTSHAGHASALSLHPCGDLLASVGVDKSFILYDLGRSEVIYRIFTDSELTCCQFHPDGHLFGAGSKSGQIKLFDVKTGASAANFDLDGPIQSLSFSENGTWLAAVVKGSTTVSIWDLRKTAEIKALDFGGRIDCVRWDYTGQFLVGAGPSSVVVQAYDKAAKEWSEPLRKACSASAVEWGPLGKSIVVLSTDGSLSLLK